jgi:prepilin-type N-terminal cleavage/methylation domain-containing protein
VRTQPDRNAPRTGFSLLELAMVLVIIALLIGGVLSMRTYVANAQLTNMMNESKFYINAFNQFQARYNAPPGDYPTASNNWTGAGNGDGNGAIFANGGAGNLPEYYYAFQHLALAGFIQGAYTGAANAYGGATAGVNVPAVTSMDHTAFFFNHPNQMDDFVSGDTIYPDGMYGNILCIAGLPANATTYPTWAFLTPKQMQKIDTKFDDGMPYTGNIVSVKVAFMPNCTIAATSTYNNYGADQKYCVVVLKMQ